MKKSILLVGGGGHCHSVLDSLVASGAYDRIGVVAKDEANYRELLEDPITAPFLAGTDEELPELHSAGWGEAFITLGSIGVPTGRRRIYSALSSIGFKIPVIVDVTAMVSAYAALEQGAFVGKKAVVNAGCAVGCCAILNTGCVVEHDCRIGAFAHVSPGAILCGNTVIGCDSHIGAGSVVRQGITVGEQSLIGAGSVVVKNVPHGVTAYGNPCKVVK